jgi:hypothetical protein
MDRRSYIILFLGLAALAALSSYLILKDTGPKGAGFTAGQRLEFTHEGKGHEVHISPPAVSSDTSGSVYISWISGGGHANNVYAMKADPDGMKPVRVNPEGLSADSIHQSPGIAAGPGGEIYVSWSSAKPVPEGALFASDLRLSRSLDGGRAFESGITINEDKPISHTFEGIAATGDGDVLVAWIDSREGWDKASTYITRVRGQGTEPGEVVKLGGDTCVCCRVSVAAGSEGMEAVLWRKVFEDNLRDMVLAFKADGDSFREGIVRNDGWKIEGCPHRGGEVAIDETGEIYVFWYTEGSLGIPELLFARSQKSVVFPEPLRIDESLSSIPDLPGMAVNGRGDVALVWEDSTAVRRSIYTRMSRDGGETFGEPVVVSKAVKSFSPDIASTPDGGFVIVWHEERFPSIVTVVQYIHPDD